MIKYENGRYRSFRPVDETAQVLTKELQKLTPKQRAAVDEIVKHAVINKKAKSIADEAEKLEWDKSTGPPISVRQWVNDKYYLGETAETLYPRLKDDMVELFEGNYYECVLTGSIGWGKDYFATTAMIRVLYELICLKSPTNTLGLGKGEVIHIVPVSHLKEAAQRVVFQGISRKLHLSPFFKGRFEETKDEIRFPGKGVIIVGGGSNDNSALGLNTWAALVDECLTYDALIGMADGSLRPLGELAETALNSAVNGAILAYDGERIVESEAFVKPASFTDVFSVVLENGSSVKATENHPFLVRRPDGTEEYVWVRDLRLGDEVVTVEALSGDRAVDPRDVLSGGRRNLVSERGRNGQAGPSVEPSKGERGAHPDRSATAPGAEGRSTPGRGAENHRGTEGRDGGQGSGRMEQGDSALRGAESSAVVSRKAQDGREESVLREDAHAGNAGQDRGSEAQPHGVASLRRDEGEDACRVGNATINSDLGRNAGADLCGADRTRVHTRDAGEALGVDEGRDGAPRSRAEGELHGLDGDATKDVRLLPGVCDHEATSVSRVDSGDEGGRLGPHRLSWNAGGSDDADLGSGPRSCLVRVRAGCDSLSGRRSGAQLPAGLPRHIQGRLACANRGERTGADTSGAASRARRRDSELLQGAGVPVLALEPILRRPTVQSAGYRAAASLEVSGSRVVSVLYAGREQTYDLMSVPHGNFIANGIVVHNTNFMGKGRRGSVSAAGQNSKFDKARGVYDTLQRRVKSRYAAKGLKGMIFLVSSKRSIHDFTERHLIEAMNANDPGVFVRDYATWDVRHNAFQGQKWFTAAVSQREGRTRIVGETQTVDLKKELKGEEIHFSFPEEYYREFLNDPEGATRDIAGIAMESFRPFFSNRPAIEAMGISKRPHPFYLYSWNPMREIQILWKNLVMENVHGSMVPRCCPGAFRHAHLDMSKNRDSTGLCVGHIAGGQKVSRHDPETGELVESVAPVIHIDFVLKIVPPHAGEIDHATVRGLVVKLRDGGLPIRSISMDTWMGLPNLQEFAKVGFKTEQVSTQKTLDPYLAAQGALYERRVISPKYPDLEKELRELELNEEGNKVDHPKTGSKDLADAWAAVIYMLSKNQVAGGSLSLTLGTSDSIKGNPGVPQPTSDGNFRWPDEPDPEVESEAGGFGTYIIT